MPHPPRKPILLLLAVVGCAAGSSNEDGSVPGDRNVETTIQFPDTGPRDSSPAGTLTVAAPAGGESWPAGSQQTLTWSATGGVGPVDLELWQAGNKLSVIATARPASGSHTWDIAPDATHGDDYTLRVVDPQSGVAGSSPAFTIANWRYRVPVTITSASALTDHQVRVTLSSSFGYGHALADGADLRFGSGSAPGTFDLPHWTETWDPSGTSHLWVKVPSLPAGQTTIYLFYGQPTASAVSDPQQTFPNQMVSTGDLTLSGAQAYDWFELKAGHTLTLTAGQALTVTAQRILIAGTVQGTGMGHAGGTGGGKGLGPGGGGGSSNAGGGGGGHGGKGGTGGGDATDTPGTGGLVNGSAGGDTIELGSGGGAGSNNPGGAGGGAVSLTGFQVQVSGTLEMDGAPGVGGGQSSGGGAGGGILVNGREVFLGGTCSVRGGDGGSGSITANDGGGGGGGGRIKVLYGSLIDSATMTTTGGTGGKYGDAGYGQPGSPGTLQTVQQGAPPIAVTLGPEESAE